MRGRAVVWRPGSASAPARMPGPSALVREGAGGSGSGHVVTAAVINTADVLLLAREVWGDTCPTLGATADFPEGRERWKQRGEPDRPWVHPGPAASRQWASASHFTLSLSLLICERGALCHFRSNKGAW